MASYAANAALAAQRAGVKHIVRSSGAGPDPASPFALPRLQGQIDALIAATGIPTTFIRPAGFMQNFATFMASNCPGHWMPC
ncbi:MAG: NmrA family NAD(P)-binding protein [Candidatus Saccharibacteria bacterium]|nr:NmrA family NAD(P)-binding protein [Rhodoferax sp.]